MFAVVARTGSAGGSFAARLSVVRVTHTLLLIAALTVSPGVCSGCATGCLERGATTSDSAPTMAAACAVAATHGCGSCSGAIQDGPPEGTASPGASPAAVADAADGLSALPCCHGRAGCDCLLEPRQGEAAVPPATSVGDAAEPMPAAIAALPPIVASSAGRRLEPVAARPPRRPVRVLYGVWRN